MEYALVRNQAGTAGGATTARSSAGMESYIGGTASATAATTVILSTTTASSTTAPLTSGAPAAPTDTAVGSSGALTEAAFKLALEAAWANGGQTDTVLCNSTNKKVISGLSSVATRNIDVGRNQEASIVAASDLYVSDWGVHKIVLHRHVRTEAVMCLDTEYWAVAMLRAPFSEKLAKTGDAEKRMLLAEFCLVCRNVSANSKINGML